MSCSKLDKFLFERVQTLGFDFEVVNFWANFPECAQGVDQKHNVFEDDGV